MDFPDIERIVVRPDELLVGQTCIRIIFLISISVCLRIIVMIAHNMIDRSREAVEFFQKLRKIEIVGIPFMVCSHVS